jgi:hypothetical protein
MIIRYMRLDKALNVPRVIPVISIKIGDRIKTISVGENTADGARRITHVRICLW